MKEKLKDLGLLAGLTGFLSYQNPEAWYAMTIVAVVTAIFHVIPKPV